jgi:CRP-like cAMP-binding protein
LESVEEIAMVTTISPLARVPLFARLTPAELSALGAELRPRRYAAGTVIFQQGDPGDALYLVAAGEVAILLRSPAGKELTLALLGPGDAFGELALLDGAPRSADAIARADARLLALPRAAVLRQLAARPEAALGALTALSRLVRRTNRLAHAACRDVRVRLARALWELADERGESEPDGLVLLPPLTQGELAGLAGVTRESANKWLGVYAARGVLRRVGGRRLLVDPDRLRLEVE